MTRRGEVAAVAQELDGSYLMCRTNGHIWIKVGMAPCDEGLKKTRECSRCETGKVTIYDFNGVFIRSYLDYAKGYLIQGLGHLSATDRGALILEEHARDSGPVEVRKIGSRAASRRVKAA